MTNKYAEIKTSPIANKKQINLLFVLKKVYGGGIFRSFTLQKVYAFL